MPKVHIAEEVDLAQSNSWKILVKAPKEAKGSPTSKTNFEVKVDLRLKNGGRGQGSRAALL